MSDVDLVELRKQIAEKRKQIKTIEGEIAELQKKGENHVLALTVEFDVGFQPSEYINRKMADVDSIEEKDLLAGLSESQAKSVKTAIGVFKRKKDESPYAVEGKSPKRTIKKKK